MTAHRFMGVACLSTLFYCTSSSSSSKRTALEVGEERVGGGLVDALLVHGDVVHHAVGGDQRIASAPGAAERTGLLGQADLAGKVAVAISYKRSKTSEGEQDHRR